jgi:hypothetical protein
MALARPGPFPLPRVIVVMTIAAALGACGKNPLQPLPPQTLVPNFSLADVNPSSATAGKNVSPRSEIGRISAWYFGHAT